MKRLPSKHHCLASLYSVSKFHPYSFLLSYMPIQVLSLNIESLRPRGHLWRSKVYKSVSSTIYEHDFFYSTSLYSRDRVLSAYHPFTIPMPTVTLPVTRVIFVICPTSIYDPLSGFLSPPITFWYLLRDCSFFSKSSCSSFPIRSQSIRVCISFPRLAYFYHGTNYFFSSFLEIVPYLTFFLVFLFTNLWGLGGASAPEHNVNTHLLCTIFNQAFYVD